MCHLYWTQALAGAEEATNALLFSLKWLMINLDREQHTPLGLPASSRPESHAGQFIELTRRSAVAEAASEQPCEDQKREVLGLGVTGSKSLVRQQDRLIKVLSTMTTARPAMATQTDAQARLRQVFKPMQVPSPMGLERALPR